MLLCFVLFFYSGTQLTLLPGNPFSKTSPTVSPSVQYGSYAYYLPHPNQPSNSHTDALVDKFAKLNAPSTEIKTQVASNNQELERRGKSSLPSTKLDASNMEGSKSVLADFNNTGDVIRNKLEPNCFKTREQYNHNSNQGGGEGRESDEIRSPQELSVGLVKLPDTDISPSDSGIEFATTVPTPSEPTIPLPNPQTSQSHDESGLTESQEAVGSDYLSCGHLRRPSLQSSSSVDSCSSPFPSPEINPVQVSEKSTGEYHPLAQSKRPIRTRCRKCAKLKQESNTLKEKLNKVQSEWNTEREQNTKQVRELIEQLHQQRQDNYELTQRVHGSEVRHREATRTIQKLQGELQNMTRLFKLQQTEQVRLKEAYDHCFTAKCELFKVQLQRADSMQCPEGTYYENAADMSQQGQYSMNNAYGPSDYTNGYYEPANSMNNTEWLTANFQAGHIY